MYRIAFAAAFLFATTAQADPVCMPRDVLESQLLDAHHERVHASGIATGAQIVMQVWTNPAGNWSIVYNGPNGIACLMSAGTDWAVVPREKPGQEG